VILSAWEIIIFKTNQPQYFQKEIAMIFVLTFHQLANANSFHMQNTTEKLQIVSYIIAPKKVLQIALKATKRVRTFTKLVEET
jgi:hypothetical protein